MTAPAWPTVSICHCGRLDVEHDYRPATKTLLARRLGTDNGLCAGYTLARVEERPPESELRRRLAAVLALVARMPGLPVPDDELVWWAGYGTALADAKRAARGETT